MHSRSNLAAALFWLGVAFILFPLALGCFALIVAISPTTALIIGGVVGFTLVDKARKRWRADDLTRRRATCTPPTWRHSTPQSSGSSTERTPMLYDNAEAVLRRLTDHFPDSEIALTRLPRPASSVEAEQIPYRHAVSVDLTAPLGALELRALLEIAGEVEEVEISLNTSALGAGSTITALFE